MKSSKYIYIILCAFVSYVAFAQENNASNNNIKTGAETSTVVHKVNWFSINDAVNNNFKEPKKIVVDVYTDWCGWCKVLDKNTFSNEHVSGYMNEHFYPVKFNAEQKDSLEIFGKTYKFVAQGRRGYHEFAAALLSGQMSYPKVVFMEVIPGVETKINVLYIISGYVDAKKFHQIATFFGDDHYKTTKWEEWAPTYVSPIQ